MKIGHVICVTCFSTMIYYYYGNVSIGIVPQIRIEIYAGLIIKSKFEEIYHILHTNLLILNNWQPSKFKSPTQGYYKHTSMKFSNVNSRKRTL